MSQKEHKPVAGNKVKTAGSSPKVITTDIATKGYSQSTVPRNLSGKNPGDK